MTNTLFIFYVYELYQLYVERCVVLMAFLKERRYLKQVRLLAF